MTRQFKSFLKICGVVIALIGAGYILHLCALHMMPYVDRVDEMPCQWIYNKGFDSCEPLKAELEIKTTPEPRGRGTAVWSRATVTNRSNCIIRMTNFHFFVNNDWLGVSSTTHISVWGPDGRPMAPAKSEFENVDIRKSDGSVERGINPYQYDPRDVSPKIIDEGSGADRNPIYLIQLPPGQSISASYSVLKPTRREVVPVQVGEYVGQAVADIPVPIEHPEKVFAVPPPGFRHLKEFDLQKPGKYTARFVVNDLIFTETYKDPTRRFWNELRPLIYAFAVGSPGGDLQKPVVVEVESGPVTFDIPR